MKKLLCIALILIAALAWGQGSQFDFLLSQQRNATTALAGGKVYFYEVGTETPKAVYTNIGLTTPAANPYTLSSSGKAQLYGSGLYKVVVKNSAGVTQYTFDNIAVNYPGGFVASQTPGAGEIPVLGPSREFRVKNGATTRNVIRDKGLSGVVFGSLDYAQSWLQGLTGVTLGAGYDPYGTPATNASDFTVYPSGAQVARVTTSGGAAFTNYTSWNPTRGANDSAKLNGFSSYTSAGASRIPVSGSNGRLKTGWMPSGSLIQTVYASTNSVVTVDQAIPIDNTVPQITEGVDVLAATITPKVVGSRLVMSVTCPVGYSSRVNGFQLALALFKNSATDAVAASLYSDAVSSNTISTRQPTLRYSVVTDSLSSITYHLRAGLGTGGATGYINGNNGSGGLFNGLSVCDIRIDEIMP